MAATALMVPVCLQFTGILKFKDAWAGFSSSTVVSLVVLFILGGILNQTTFLDDLKKWVVEKLGSGSKGKRKVLLASMLMSMIFSTFASPVSAMAIMLPIVVSIARETGLPVKNTIKACTDVACTSNNVLPFGTALTACITFNGYLEAAGATQRFAFADPFLAKVPIFIVFFLYIYFVGFRFYAKETDSEEIGEVKVEAKKKERKKAELTPFQNRLGKVLFFGSAAGMILISTFTDLDMYVVGAVAIIIALAAKVIDQKEAIRSICWETIFIYGGTYNHHHGKHLHHMQARQMHGNRRYGSYYRHKILIDRHQLATDEFYRRIHQQISQKSRTQHYKSEHEPWAGSGAAMENSGFRKPFQ